MKLSIVGDWWDGYVYASHLYLVQIDGSVVIVPWPRLIDHVIDRNGLDRLAAELAFVDARYLYGEQWSRLVQDPEIGRVLKDKFNRLAQADLSVDKHDLAAVKARTCLRVAPEMTADIEIHRNTLYFGGEDGLWAQHQARLIDRPAEKIWDAHLYRVRASQGVLALAAGPDGLFQDRAQYGRPRRMQDADAVVRGDFFSCGWLATNIYASSYSNAGTLAVFRQERAHRERVTHRVFEAAVADQTLFDPVRTAELAFDRRERPSGSSERRGEPPPPSPAPDEHVHENVVFERRLPAPQAEPHVGGLSWGGHDRICQVDGENVRVAIYAPRRRYFANRFQRGPSLKLGPSQQVITGDVAPFGVVVETETDLFVIADEGVWNLGYEPARWRSFSRATNYPNHLHVMDEGKLDVFSFLTASLQEHTRSAPMGPTSSRRR